MKLFCKKKEPVTYDEKYLVEEINMTKAALSAAYANSITATDPDLIDCYIYQLTLNRNAINTFSKRLKNRKYILIFQISDVYYKYGVPYIYYILTILSIIF